jgi:hypothetical protein
MLNWTEPDLAAILDGSMSYRDVKSTYHIPEGTVASRSNGAQERYDAHTYERRLTKGQEEELAEWTFDMDAERQLPSHQRCHLVVVGFQREFGFEEDLGHEWL